jgi:hypothetical protein
LSSRKIKRFISLAITILTVIIGFISICEKINCERDIVKITEISNIEKYYETNENGENLTPYYSANATAESDSGKVYNFKIERYNESNFPIIGENIEIGILEDGTVFEYEETFNTNDIFPNFKVPGIDTSDMVLSDIDININ